MAGPWEQFAEPKQAAPWEQFQQETNNPAGLLSGDAVKDTVEANPGGYFGRIVDAFKSGSEEGYGTEQFGFSDANKKWLRDSTNETYKSAVDNVLIPSVEYLDSLWRTPNSIYHALGDAAIAAGLPRDFVAMAGGEAQYGSPGQFMRHGPGEAAAEPAGVASTAIQYKGQLYKGLPGESHLDIATRNKMDLDVGPSEMNADLFHLPSGEIVNRQELRNRGLTGGVEDINTFSRGALQARIEANQEPATDARVAVAQGLGVVGPEKPRLSEGTSQEAAESATKQRAMAAGQKPDDRISGPAPDDNPWEQRFNQFVDKLDTGGDVKQLIQDAAKENDNFMPARQGDIPLGQVDSLAEAAGVASDTVDPRGVGRLMKNDNEVRVGMRLMLQATDAVKDAARAVKADGSPESLIKLQETMMRRDLAVEQIVGLRAEWGRTGNVFQEFMRDVKDQDTLNQFLKDKGRSPGDLKDIADAIDTLDRTQAARVMSDMHSKAPTPFYWTWVNGLISGWLTHTKYVAANTLYAASENGVTPALAAMIGKAKQVFGADVDRVYFGEPMAATWGLISAVPSAVIATGKSIYSGQRAVLKSEIEVHKAMVERGDKVPALIDRAVNQVTGQGRPTDKLFGVIPLDGIWGRIIGAPGDAAMGIHTFFKVLGERAGIESEAYRAAAKEGLSPTDAEFWRRRAEHSENPTEEMRTSAIANAYKGTFMSELGPRGKAMQRFVKEIPGLKWVMPFMHIPLNLMKATYEHLPLAVLDSDMRADIMGANGGVKQDKAIARMVVGSAIMGYFVHAGMNGRATGDYPIDPKERDAWNLQGKQPNSILINNYWVSYNKFGPAGDLANLGANIAYVIPKLTSGDDDAMALGTFHAANAAAHLIVDEVGFQSLANMFEAMHDEKKGAAWVASTAASFVPFSSLLRQTASYNDPYMRQAKSIFDGIKVALPVERETLLPKQDWLGQPVPNAQFGNILRQRQAINDPVSQEMMRLEIHPGLPSDRIGGVKLTPDAYSRFNAVAGSLTKQALDSMVGTPGWADLPDYAREVAIRSTIHTTRKLAEGAMQAANPALIEQGVKQVTDHITGAAHTSRPKTAPALP